MDDVLREVEETGKRALELEERGDKAGAQHLYEQATARLFARASDESSPSTETVASSRTNLARAADAHAEGNRLFREDAYEEATCAYDEALRFADRIVPTTSGEKDHVWKDARSLIAKVRCNLAQCYLRTGEYRKAIEACNAVLVRDTKNAKALWRRSQAYLELGEWRDATRDLNALERRTTDDDPTAASVRKRIAKARRKIDLQRAARREKQKKLSKRFLASGHDDRSSSRPKATPASRFAILASALRFVLSVVSSPRWWFRLFSSFSRVVSRALRRIRSF